MRVHRTLGLSFYKETVSVQSAIH